MNAFDEIIALNWPMWHPELWIAYHCALPLDWFREELGRKLIVFLGGYTGLDSERCKLVCFIAWLKPRIAPELWQDIAERNGVL